MSGIEAAFFGVLGRDAESKVSGSGKHYLRLNVRVGDGDQAQWISVMTFDQSAIDTADKLIKGTNAYIEGRLTASEWTGQDGAKRHGLSCMSWHCRLSQIGRNKVKSKKPQTAGSGRARAAGSLHAPLGNGTPFNDDIGF
jgi:single-stranded DNA-binding protein